MKRQNRNILRIAEGGTIFEYAIVLPILLLIIMSIVEYNTIMYAESMLDGAITAAAREGSTGYVNDASTGTCPSPVVNGVVSPQSQATYINCYVAVHVSGFLNGNNLQVSYNDTGTSTFNSANDTPTYPTGPCTNNPALANPPSYPLCSENSQNAGDIVVYTVTYPWAIYTPLLQPFLGSTFTLSASTIVKNEPYSPTSR